MLDVYYRKEEWVISHVYDPIYLSITTTFIGKPGLGCVLCEMMFITRSFVLAQKCLVFYT